MPGTACNLPPAVATHSRTSEGAVQRGRGGLVPLQGVCRNPGNEQHELAGIQCPHFSQDSCSYFIRNDADRTMRSCMSWLPARRLRHPSFPSHRSPSPPVIRSWHPLPAQQCVWMVGRGCGLTSVMPRGSTRCKASCQIILIVRRKVQYNK